MNEIHNLIYKYRNWKKHFHLCNFKMMYEDSEYPTWCRNGGYIAFTFYFETFFGRIKTRTLTLFKIGNMTASDRTVYLQSKLVKAEKMVAQISEAIQKEYGTKENHNELRLKKLIADAYDCMLLENPLKTSQFIIEFLDCFAPIKENQNKHEKAD